MEKAPVLISIVIPTYNYAQYLPRVIASVFRQASECFELIVVDDASTDNTANVITDMVIAGCPVFRYHRLPRNQGVSAARNKGISLAKGQYIYFLDCDDELLEGGLQQFEQAIKDNASASMLVAQYFSVQVGGQKKTRCLWQFSSSKEENFKRYLLNVENSLLCSSIVFKRSVFDHYRFPEHLRLYEDEPVFSHMLANYHVAKIDQPVVLIHKHEGSLRHKIHHGLVEASVNETFNATRLPQTLMAYRDPYLGLKYLDQFRTLFLAGEYGLALDQYASGFLYNKKAALRPTFLRKAIKSWFRR
ncbi:glycosyltransferase family 2 protein [Candidatus Sororendozoicomonas aggregata]|uniref:glycosyltransferase family 2 protein n=1 Tax=Candidatus Sororendozoicomonas aggregata TaxID=3073239 RepID=UPI002ED6B8F6